MTNLVPGAKVVIKVKKVPGTKFYIFINKNPVGSKFHYSLQGKSFNGTDPA